MPKNCSANEYRPHQRNNPHRTDMESKRDRRKSWLIGHRQADTVPLGISHRLTLAKRPIASFLTRHCYVSDRGELAKLEAASQADIACEKNRRTRCIQLTHRAAACCLRALQYLGKQTCNSSLSKRRSWSDVQLPETSKTQAQQGWQSEHPRLRQPRCQQTSTVKTGECQRYRARCILHHRRRDRCYSSTTHS